MGNHTLFENFCQAYHKLSLKYHPDQSVRNMHNIFLTVIQ